MNLGKFQTLIRHTTRILYTNPIAHLLIDFIIENSVAERNTFAHKHKNIFPKDVQKVLHELDGHGILNKRSIKIDKFKELYHEKLADKDFNYK